MMDVAPIGPLVPFVCSYTGPGGREFGITLWATDDETIMRSWRRELCNLRVDGVLIATYAQRGTLGNDFLPCAATVKKSAKRR